MKTQIIQLEIHDDTISVKDKMDWSQTPRVLLVWPDDGKVLRNQLDLILLERYCTANGSRLALATDDKRVIYQAKEIGIPVFRSRSAAQLQFWGKSSREPIRQQIKEESQQPRDTSWINTKQEIKQFELPPWAKIIIFAIAVFSVLAIGAVLLPSATINLPTVIQTRNITIPVQAITDQKDVQISGIVPARELILTVEGQVTTSTSGTVNVPFEYAAGEVIFTNLSDRSISIPENTVLSTADQESQLFITLEPGFTSEESGSQITLPVRALKPGTQGNIPANTITRIFQDIGADLTVTNPEPLLGGTDITVSAPVESDYQRASSELNKTLVGIAQQEAARSLTDDDFQLSKQPEIIQVLDSTTQPDLGSAGDEVTLTNIVEVKVYYTSAADLQKFAELTVQALYSGDTSEPIVSSIRMDHKSDPTEGSAGIYSWNLQLTWNEYRKFDQEKIIQNVLGKKPVVAEIQLRESLNLIDQPEINLNPTWWFRIPALPFRIRIVEVSE